MCAQDEGILTFIMGFHARRDVACPRDHVSYESFSSSRREEEKVVYINNRKYRNNDERWYFSSLF